MNTTVTHCTGSEYPAMEPLNIRRPPVDIVVNMRHMASTGATPRSSSRARLMALRTA